MSLLKTKLFTKGLNFHGQCGLGKEIQYSINKFMEVSLPEDIDSVYTNTAHSFLLSHTKKTIYYFGFSWDLRSFIRTSNYFNSIPRIMTFSKSIWPPLMSFPNSISILGTFPNTIEQISVGGAYALALDSEGIAYSIGDNTHGQLGIVNREDQYKFEKVIFPFNNNTSKNSSNSMYFSNNNNKIVKVSAGFQHSVFLDIEGNVYGCGKADKKQLGLYALENYIIHDENVNDYKNCPKQIKLEEVDGKIIDAQAGKYHTVILTDTGKVYAIGVNKFGQLGISNLQNFTSYTPIEIVFEKKCFIKEMAIGDNHNIFLTEKGEVFSNGDNNIGQINGELDNPIYYECSPIKLKFSSSGSSNTNEKAEKVYAKNFRSAVRLKNNKHIFWGGFSYDPSFRIKDLPRYDGYNLYKDEVGLEILKSSTTNNNSKIKDIGIGFYHDLVLVNC